jgi:hypothetical protein
VEQSGTNLEIALATLIQNQAAFVQGMTEFRQEMTEMRKDFSRIEAYLIRHERLLAALPEAIKEKIGFN